MKVEIKVPTLGESISEATVSSILKPNGSFVAQDEEILELETDKVTLEMRQCAKKLNYFTMYNVKGS